MPILLSLLTVLGQQCGLDQRWDNSTDSGSTLGQLALLLHYSDVIISAMASHINGVSIVWSTRTVCSGADQRKQQSSESLAFVWGIHRWPVNSPHKMPVTRKMFPFDDVIMRVWHYPCRQNGIISTHGFQWLGPYQPYVGPIFKHTLLL